MGAVIVFLIIVVLVIFVMVKLIVFIFKPSTKTTKITKVDENGKEVIEYHETKDNSGMGILARIVAIVVFLGILLFVLMVASIVFNASS